MKIEKLGEKYQIVIPQEVREVLNLQPGDSLEVKVVNGTVVMTPANSKASRLWGKIVKFGKEKMLLLIFGNNENYGEIRRASRC